MKTLHHRTPAALRRAAEQAIRAAVPAASETLDASYWGRDSREGDFFIVAYVAQRDGDEDEIAAAAAVEAAMLGCPACAAMMAASEAEEAVDEERRRQNRAAAAKEAAEKAAAKAAAEKAAAERDAAVQRLIEAANAANATTSTSPFGLGEPDWTPRRNDPTPLACEVRQAVSGDFSYADGDGGFTSYYNPGGDRMSTRWVLHPALVSLPDAKLISLAIRLEGQNARRDRATWSRRDARIAYQKAVEERSYWTTRLALEAADAAKRAPQKNARKAAVDDYRQFQAEKIAAETAAAESLKAENSDPVNGLGNAFAALGL